MDEVPQWLGEVLHVMWGFARREHEPPATLVPGHAQAALDAVPEEVLRAVGVDRTWCERDAPRAGRSGTTGAVART